MREITIKLKIDGVDMSTKFTEDDYKLIKNKTGLDPIAISINKMWDEINKHKDISDNPIQR